MATATPPAFRRFTTVGSTDELPASMHWSTARRRGRAYGQDSWTGMALIAAATAARRSGRPIELMVNGRRLTVHA